MAGSDQEVDFDIPQYLRYLLNLTADTYEAMWAAEAEQNMRGPSGDAEARFESLLKRLYFGYEPKFNYTDKVELDDELEDLEAWELEDELDFEQKKKLVRKIRDLQEAIGHTKYTREQHQDQGVGPGGQK